MYKQMESYYRMPCMAENDLAWDSDALVINCCGRLVLDRPFLTHAPAGRQDYYLLWLCEGRLRLDYGDHMSGYDAVERLRSDGTDRLIMETGDLVLIPPNHPYVYESLTDNTLYYWLHFSGSHAGALASVFDQDTKIKSPGLHEGSEALFMDLFKQFIVRDDLFNLACHSVLMRLVWGLARRLRTRHQAIRRRAIPLTSLQYIHRNLSGPMQIDELAAMEHLSPSRYRAVFRETMGSSPSEYIIEQRMQRACELMEHFDMSITEVAAAVGYSDPLYFSRLFKKRLGVNPTTYAGARGRNG